MRVFSSQPVLPVACIIFTASNLLGQKHQYYFLSCPVFQVRRKLSSISLTVDGADDYLHTTPPRLCFISLPSTIVDRASLLVCRALGLEVDSGPLAVEYSVCSSRYWICSYPVGLDNLTGDLILCMIVHFSDEVP
jgi:hypothetical protein